MISIRGGCFDDEDDMIFIERHAADGIGEHGNGSAMGRNFSFRLVLEDRCRQPARKETPQWT